MGSNNCVVFTVSFFLLIIYQAGGTKTDKHLVRESNWLDKPIFKTITTENGDIFDCVDIHKQPSLDHPLLQNHTLQMKPSVMLEASSPHESTEKEEYAQVELEGEGCPDGSVPIKRIEKKDLKRLQAYLKENPSALNPNSMQHPGWHFANVYTRRLGIQFQAARGKLNVFNPSTIYRDQHSDTLIYVEHGQFFTHNIIQAGWTVFPAVYGDNRTRLHTMWTADNYRKTGCLNIHCQGFVQISKNIPLGAQLQPASQYGGKQYYFSISIFHDQFSGNWWLIAGMNAVIGYWPKEIFTGLRSYAEAAGWGGRVYSPIATIAPPMGSGHKPYEGKGKSCFVEEMQFVKSGEGAYEDLDANMLINHVDVPRCYDVKVFVDSRQKANILFGGPGGDCGRMDNII